MSDTPQNTSWLDTFSPEDKGYLANKGWDKIADAPTAVTTILKSYKEAEARVGIPQAEIVRLAAQPTPEQLGEVYKRLGVPDKPEAYAFEGVPDDRAGLLKALAFENKLTPAQAQSVAAGLTKAETDKATASAAARTIAEQAEDLKLRAAWTGNYDEFKARTESFVAKSGLTPEQAAVFTSTAQGRMMLFAVASADREAGMPGASSPGGARGTGPMSREQAAAALEAKKADPAWVASYFNREGTNPGHAAALKDFQDLTTLMAGGQPARQ